MGFYRIIMVGSGDSGPSLESIRLESAVHQQAGNALMRFVASPKGELVSAEHSIELHDESEILEKIGRQTEVGRRRTVSLVKNGITCRVYAEVYGEASFIMPQHYAYWRDKDLQRFASMFIEVDHEGHSGNLDGIVSVYTEPYIDGSVIYQPSDDPGVQQSIDTFMDYLGFDKLSFGPHNDDFREKFGDFNHIEASLLAMGLQRLSELPDDDIVEL